MNYLEWQKRRAGWMEIEKQERSVNWQQARGNIQTALTEQAVRELFDRVEALEAKARPAPIKERA